MSTEAPPAAEPAATPAPAAPATPAAGFLGATPAPAAAPEGGAPAAPSSSFFFDGRLHKEGSFNEGWADNLRTAGFERLANKGALHKDEGSFLRSLDDALGLVGKKASGYPTAASSEAEIADYRRAAGVPDEPAGYTLKPEKLPEGVEWDDAGAGEFAGVLHKHHATAALAKELGEMWTNQQVKFREAAAGGFESKIGELSAECSKVFGKEWGEGASDRQQANSDFVTARGLDVADPIVRMALSHPDIVRLVDEARRASREMPIPGVDAAVFTGSGSPREQAQAIIRANPQYQQNPEINRRVMDLYAQQEQIDKRSARR